MPTQFRFRNYYINLPSWIEVLFTLPMPEMLQISRSNRLGYEVIRSTSKSGITFDACLHLEATSSIQDVTTMVHQNGTTFHIWLWSKYGESKWQTQNMQIRRGQKTKIPIQYLPPSVPPSSSLFQTKNILKGPWRPQKKHIHLQSLIFQKLIHQKPTPNNSHHPPSLSPPPCPVMVLGPSVGWAETNAAPLQHSTPRHRPTPKSLPPSMPSMPPPWWWPNNPNQGRLLGWCFFWKRNYCLQWPSRKKKLLPHLKKDLDNFGPSLTTTTTTSPKTPPINLWNGPQKTTFKFILLASSKALKSKRLPSTALQRSAGISKSWSQVPYHRFGIKFVGAEFEMK